MRLKTAGDAGTEPLSGQVADLMPAGNEASTEQKGPIVCSVFFSDETCWDSRWCLLEIAMVEAGGAERTN